MNRLDLEQALRDKATSLGQFDKFLFLSNPHLVREVTRHLSLLIPDGTQALFGIGMGGITLGTALALQTNIPLAYEREKKGYGTDVSLEGINVYGKQIVLVQDVIQTGSRLNLTADHLAPFSPRITAALSVFETQEARTTLATTPFPVYALFHL